MIFFALTICETAMAVLLFVRWSRPGFGVSQQVSEVRGWFGRRLGPIGERFATVTGDKRATYVLFQAISMAVQTPERECIASITGSIPKSKSLDELSYL